MTRSMIKTIGGYFGDIGCVGLPSEILRKYKGSHSGRVNSTRINPCPKLVLNCHVVLKATLCSYR